MRDRRSRLHARRGLLALLILLMLPNGLWLLLAGHHSPVLFAKVAVAGVLTATWFALFGRALWLGCLLLAPLALVAPLEVYYIARYHAPTSVNALGTIAATSMPETRQYLGYTGIVLALACAVTLGVALWAAWWTWRSELCWRGRLRRWIVGAGLAGLVGAALAGVAGAMSVNAGPTRSIAARAATADEREMHTLVHWVESGYPFGAPVRIARFIGYRQEMRHEVGHLHKFSFHAHMATRIASRQIYVLVIGESSRRDHWQLFGYTRHTTPRLARTAGLVPIRHMVSAFSQTMTALPVMLTRKPADWAGEAMWREPSIVMAMKEAGFETWWISNQYPLKPEQSAVAAYAREADHLMWLNKTQGPASDKMDEDLVGALRKAVQHGTGNLFIVLHMLGSHRIYDHRYPAAFKRFTPTQSSGRDPSIPDWQRAVNSYDNTIVYTDHVLSRIIHVLQSTDATSALWYASDHGETLPSPRCHETSHGHENRPEYEIAAFFWYSRAYARAFPERVATIRHNADKPTMSEDEFPSLVDMANVDMPSHARHEDRSLFSSHWKPHTRWVNQFQRVDFDRARVVGACHKLARRNAPRVPP